MREKRDNNKKNTAAAVVENALFLLCLAGMAALRITAVFSAEPNPFFEEAAVRNGQSIVLTGLGARDLYLLLLHGILFIFGNKVTAAAIAQAVLQVIAAVFVYGALRQSAGRVTAFIALGFWGYIPYFWRAFMELTPAALVFALESLALWAISGIWRHWNRENDAGSPADALLRYLYIGLLAGLCCCLDISGFVVLFFLLWVIFFGRKRGGTWGEEDPSGFWNRKGLVCAFCFAAGIVCFVGIQVILGVMSGTNPPHVMGLWLREVLGGSFRGAAKLSDFLNAEVLLCLFCIAAAGRPAAQLWQRKADESADAGGLGRERKSAGEETSGNGASGVREDSEDTDIQYIENPLPLPKKVEKKRLDYDYEVSDDDDYDIP